MKCPTCGKELSVYYSDFEQIDEKCINLFAGQCINCNDNYEWKEIYTLDEITIPKKIE